MDSPGKDLASSGFHLVWHAEIANASSTGWYNPISILPLDQCFGITSVVLMPKLNTATDAPSLMWQKRGDPSAPGPPCICAHFERNAPMRSGDSASPCNGTLLTPSTPATFPQVFSRRLTYFGVVKSDIVPVQVVFQSEFDSRQLHNRQARPKGLACFVSRQHSAACRPESTGTFGTRRRSSLR